MTNTFWFFNSNASNPTLKNFKVEGFSNGDDTGSSDLSNLSGFIKERTEKVTDDQKSINRITTRSIENLLHNFRPKCIIEVLVPISKLKLTFSYFIYLIMYTFGRGCTYMDNLIQKWMSDIMDSINILNLLSALFNS